MKIGVSGASGHLGRAVVSELLRRPGGHKVVVAITRTPETVAAPAQGLFGDYDRPETLAEAYAGLDRLLIIPALEPGKRAAQNVAAIDAAVRAGVKHIVFMSTAGARQEEEPALGASYWRGEQHLIATAPTWTILRMNYYAEGLVQQAAAQASPRRACWGAEISFGLMTCTRTDLLPDWGRQPGSPHQGYAE